MPLTPEEEAKVKEDQKNAFSRFFDWINPFSGSSSGSSGFSIGGIFQTLLVAVIAYVAASNEKVQGWLGQFLDEKDPTTGEKIPGTGAQKIKKVTDGIANWVKGNMVPDFVKENFDVTEMMQNPNPEDSNVKAFLETLPAALQPVVKDNLKTLTNLVLDANKDAKGRMNGAQVKLETFTNDKTLFALLTKQPALAKQIITALQKFDGYRRYKVQRSIWGKSSLH